MASDIELTIVSTYYRKRTRIRSIWRGYVKAEVAGIINAENTTTVAVKMVKCGADPVHSRQAELEIMKHLGRYLNIVKLLGACTRDINKRELTSFCIERAGVNV